MCWSLIHMLISHSCIYSVPRYDGEWKNDKKEGLGTLEMATGDRYDGEWLEGKKNGTGTYTFVNNDSYEGYFQNGLRQGKNISLDLRKLLYTMNE